MPSGKEGPNYEENLYFWLERTVCAMRAAKGGALRQGKSLESQSSAGAWQDECSGLSMPESCWKRFGRHIRTIATYGGLTVKIVERYTDPLGVVYVVFVRKEKDV